MNFLRFWKGKVFPAFLLPGGATALATSPLPTGGAKEWGTSLFVAMVP